MKIEMKNLREGPVDLKLDATPGELELSDEQFEFPERVTGEIRYQLAGEKVFARGDASTKVGTRCNRCLEPMLVPITGHVEVMYEDNPELLKPEKRFLGSEDSFVAHFDGEAVEPEAEIREALMLELPYLTVCPEDCKGLCPRCGANLNNEPCNCVIAPQDEPAWKKSLKQLKLG